MFYKMYPTELYSLKRHYRALLCASFTLIINFDNGYNFTLILALFLRYLTPKAKYSKPKNVSDQRPTKKYMYNLSRDIKINLKTKEALESKSWKY